MWCHGGHVGVPKQTNEFPIIIVHCEVIYEIVHILNCGRIWNQISYLISNTQFHTWNFSYITSHSFPTGSLELTNDKLPTSVASYLSWLERRTGIAVQTPLKSWLFQASIRNCLICVHSCDDHRLLYIVFQVQAQCPKYTKWLHATPGAR